MKKEKTEVEKQKTLQKKVSRSSLEVDSKPNGEFSIPTESIGSKIQLN